MIILNSLVVNYLRSVLVFGLYTLIERGTETALVKKDCSGIPPQIHGLPQKTTA